MVETPKPCHESFRRWCSGPARGYLLEQLAAGDTTEEILAGYPRLTREDISAALAYAATALRPVRLPEAAE